MVDIIRKLFPKKVETTDEPHRPAKRFVGMSANKNTVKKLQNIPKPKLLPEVKMSFAFNNPLAPYIEIVRGDIARLFGRDAQSVKRKEEYNDFMEQHFGNNKEGGK